MKLLFAHRTHHVVVIVGLLLLAAVARYPFTTLDFNSLLATYLVDDAFYYFKIASHFATEYRMTYDGDQLSNGFHPLWLLLITPFYTAANNGVDFVYRVQWLMLAIDLLSVVMLYFTLLRLRVSGILAALGAVLFCIHSTFIDIQMNGLETSLNTLVLLLLLNVFVVVFVQEHPSWRAYATFGLVAGMAFLARTDNGIAIALLYLVLAWRGRAQWKQAIPLLVVSLLVTSLIALPWLLWNIFYFGSFVQGSGKIETIVWGEPHFSWQRTVLDGLLLPIKVYEQLKPFSRLFVAPSGNATWMAGGFLVWVACTFIWFLRSKRVSTELKALAVFCIAVLAVFSYHAAFRHFVRTWYYMPVGLVFLLLTVGIASILDKRAGFLLLFLSIAVVGWQFSPLKLAGKVTELTSHLIVADWININIPSNAVVGSMNSGVLSYLVHRKVINLDGVVDARSMRAHWDKRQPEYIHERGIQYLVDNDGGLQFFCHENPLHTCVTVFTFGDVNTPSKVVHIVNK